MKNSRFMKNSVVIGKTQFSSKIAAGLGKILLGGISVVALFSLPTSKHHSKSEMRSTFPLIQTAHAQEIAEGVVGTIDKKRRSPVFSVEPKVSPEKVEIILNTTIPADEYEPYPVRFELFVNDKFVTSKYQPAELRGPLSFEITPELATAPFKYVISATLLHPNRQFVTVAQGAIYEQDFFTTLGCTVVKTTTTAAGEEQQTEYSNSEVKITQPGNSKLELEFAGSYTNDAGDEKTEQIKASLDYQKQASTDNRSTGATDLADTAGQATGTVTIGELPATSVEGTATINTTTKKLSAISVASPSGKLTLECGDTITTQSTPTSEQEANTQSLEKLF